MPFQQAEAAYLEYKEEEENVPLACSSAQRMVLALAGPVKRSVLYSSPQAVQGST